MRSVNKVFLYGNVGRDPETKTTAGGKVVTTFSLATNRRVREGEGWANFAEWHNIVTFDWLAQRAQSGIRRGQPIAVIGAIRPQSWKNAQGETKRRVEIVAENLCFDQPRKELGDGTVGSSRVEAAANSPLPKSAEIPF